MKSKLETCSQMKHSTIWQGSSFCISQIPVMQCGTGCAPRSIVTKPMPFVCLPATRERVIKLYEEKVRREMSFQSSETCRRLSLLRCMSQSPVLTQDFKLFELNLNKL